MKQIVLAWLLMVSLLQAATIRVPQDQATIQAGINAAVNGDTVLVGPGVYYANIALIKSIAIISASGPDSTTILPATSSVQTIQADDCNPTISGFTFTGSSAISAIRFTKCNTRVVNCIVRNNACTISPVEFYGGTSGFVGSCVVDKCQVYGNNGGQFSCGILLTDMDDHSVIQNSIFHNNSGRHGGGITLWRTLNSKVSRCLVYDNTVSMYGGGIALVSGCSLDSVLNNTVIDNVSTGALGGGMYLQESSCLARNNIVANCQGHGIVEGSYSFNDSYANSPTNFSSGLPGTGNISSDPQFSGGLGSFLLSDVSPCINAGDPNPIYNDPDGSRNDMGALPFVSPDTRRQVPEEYPTIQSAIDAAIDGDTVLVSDGLYRERLSCYSKSITVGSYHLLDGDTVHITNTIIDGDTTYLPASDTMSVVRFTGNAAILRGLTIRGGISEGILAVNSSPSIFDCRLVQNGIRVVESDVAIRRTKIEVSGVSARGEGSIWIAQSQVEGKLVGSTVGFQIPNFFVDSCEIGGVGLGPQNEIRARGTKFTGPFWCDFSASVHLVQCTVDSAILASAETGVHVDSSEIAGLSCENEVIAYIRNSLIKGPLQFASGSVPPVISLSHCTVVDSICILSGGGFLTLDSCNVALPSPIYFQNGRPNLSVRCSNVIAPGGQFWAGQPPVGPYIDTLNLFSLPPLFCDTASGDYRIKDSSPCAPANNSCGVLIGAYGIGCANIAPALTSADSAQAVSGLGFVYKAASTDSDGPATNYSFINRPSWLTANGDSVFGIPPLTDIDTSFMVIVSDGFLADSQLVTVEITESPIISALTTEGVAVAKNVISHTPPFGWQYFDATGSYPQTQFEIAVGSDADWTYAELWNPAPFNGGATSKQYAGAALVDGQTYWVRARVRNALIWSNWKQTSFRMNSVPTAPQLRLPANNNIVASQFPNLTIRNPIDAESDSMFLTFEISADSFATSFFPFQAAPSNDSLTTVAVPVMLNENARFWWRVKGSDYYEESAYSPIWSFWINSSNSAPSAFSLLSPPNAQSPALADNTPELTWQPSFDFDPGDSVKFTLQLSIDASFSFASQIPGLTVPQYTPASPLEWGRRYWWRVKAEDKAAGLTWSHEVFTFTVMRLGDPDGNGMVTISDAVFLINYIFAGGPAPNPLLSGDADCNGIVTISDAVYLINYIFAAGPAPCE